MIHRPHYNIYIAACDEQGGIYHYRMDGNGHLTLETSVALDRPMYLARQGEWLYAPLRAPYAGSEESGLTRVRILADGGLGQADTPVPTHGKVCCHLAVEGDTVYCVNYLSACVVRLPDTVVTHCGKGPHSTRQTEPHPHFVCLSPDKKYVCVVDLGIDKILFYDKQMQPCFEAAVPSGSGARHIAFSPDGAYLYCANELSSTVSVFSYRENEVTLLDTYSTLPEGFSAESTVAAIKTDNGHLYVSNRGHDSIAVFEMHGGKLLRKAIVPCGGSSPRDFAVIGNFLLSTNENSDNVAVFRLRDGVPDELVEQISLKKPLCVIGEEAYGSIG